MKEIFLVQAAEADLQRTYNYFENREEGLGETFYAAIQTALARISQFPEIGVIVEGAIRRFLLRTFQYGIFYEVYPTRVAVFGIMDLRQDPEYILRRLRDSMN